MRAGLVSSNRMLAARMKFGTFLDFACLAPALFGATTARADGGCGYPARPFDTLGCEASRYEQLERQMSSRYRNIQTALRMRFAERDRLDAGQRDWLDRLGRNCSTRMSSGTYLNLACANDMLARRLAFMRDREQECYSQHGCVPARFRE